jgi:hypothetical protein
MLTIIQIMSAFPSHAKQCAMLVVVLLQYDILSISLHNDNRISMFKSMFVRNFGPKGTEK